MIKAAFFSNVAGFGWWHVSSFGAARWRGW